MLLLLLMSSFFEIIDQIGNTEPSLKPLLLGDSVFGLAEEKPQLWQFYYFCWCVRGFLRALKRCSPSRFFRSHRMPQVYRVDLRAAIYNVYTFVFNVYNIVTLLLLLRSFSSFCFPSSFSELTHSLHSNLKLMSEWLSEFGYCWNDSFATAMNYAADCILHKLNSYTN